MSPLSSHFLLLDENRHNCLIFFIYGFYFCLLFLCLLMFPGSSTASAWLIDPSSSGCHLIKWLSQCLNMVFTGQWHFKRYCALPVYNDGFLLWTVLIFNLFGCFFCRKTKTTSVNFTSRTVLISLLQSLVIIGAVKYVAGEFWKIGCLGYCWCLSNTLSMLLTVLVCTFLDLFRGILNFT